MSSFTGTDPALPLGDVREVDSIIACLGDDANTLRQDNDACEIAANMDAAADLLAKYESLLLFALYYHQGGSSPLGQPIRKALEIGEHDELNSGQIVRAKLAAQA